MNANGSQNSESSESSEKAIARLVYLSLFSKKKEIQRNVVTTYFDVNAVFENPILLVESHDQIINQFHLLSAFFYAITPEIQSVTNSKIAGNHHLVCIDALIKYRFPLQFPSFPCLRIVFGKNSQFCNNCNNEFTLRIISRFEFNEQHKIVRHEDIWSLKDLLESLPVVGWIYAEIARKLTGMVTGGVVIAVKELTHGMSGIFDL
ncbi:hypothetical protein RhiirA5_420096 [Rhizophagus irregularis]|uniref:Uncharacterized protein n=3 Tax=Rhizophagus irregularis TaxID=588596 RepID=A0A2I1EWW4_9GLOM|nr:hypothetical protein GLOIN_2v1786566 [Rhizophagus irregularis DAOM 181602=DAOM 197198]EXX69939.1 hypothetical protein RirG_091770 [Rhizophagus irregularis DAOM 197198w]PKC06059.1 hypothetical protein RhiirA5_420096 [Rhizophagus irregularis]PKC60679.1 hypothetical protein RhiirA1_489657 [Rhizophagus irregularis]PKK66598.1 hypothetical protein RhiirC2_25961 [Rhizophagus irregularis]PKY26598.1 hypothetical protein RhiirB3_513914 [Rhizophagus irregularis]|eukprot:XP_025168354.1 hypothetical protein GLOIN_2v1786566 [Rhizophagus irregularis DAOM 181602=DAOM 197198]